VKVWKKEPSDWKPESKDSGVPATEVTVCVPGLSQCHSTVSPTWMVASPEKKKLSTPTWTVWGEARASATTSALGVLEWPAQEQEAPQ